MTISNSLPIKFWLIDDPTYNESEICGVYPDCFCEHVNYGEDLTIQFNHDMSPFLAAYRYDDDSFLNAVNFVLVDPETWQLTFKPNEFVLDETVKVFYFKIISGVTELAKSGCVVIGGCLDFGEVNKYSEATVDWEDGINPFTSKTGDLLLKTSPGLLTIYSAHTPIVVASPTQTPETLGLTVSVSGLTGTKTVLFEIFYNDSLGSVIYSASASSGNGTSVKTFTFSPSGPFNDIAEIEIRATVQAGTGNNPTLLSLKLPKDTLLFEGDNAGFSKCFDLDCSTTINYTNTKNFDGIVYEISPVPSFQIVLPAQFWQEDEPMEKSDIELSNGEIVTLRQTIETKRLLETGYMPNYMHQKLRRILMHDTVTIEGTEWRVRDPYETDPIKRYGMKKGKIWLTEYNSVEKNTL